MQDRPREEAKEDAQEIGEVLGTEAVRSKKYKKEIQIADAQLDRMLASIIESGLNFDNSEAGMTKIAGEHL